MPRATPRRTDVRRAPPDARQPVLLYDGTCGLCHAVVRFLLRRDASGRLHFAPLQSAPAQAYLHAQNLPTQDFDSLVFVPDWNNPAPGAYQLRTDGALGAADELGGPWRALAWARFIPRALRDLGYRLVARSRHTLFGRYQPSPLPRPDWEKRFLAR
jgi:predicted DCC family thiol-disulfide oxidoreductase YuxK